MAVGDAAAAVGMDLVPGSRPANEIDTAINETRDYIAEHTQPVRDATAFATDDTLMRRGTGGRVYVGTPTVGGNATTKDYVDAAVAGVVADATALATPNTLMRRADGGRVNVGTPVFSDNAVTKAYADGLLSGPTITGTAQFNGSVGVNGNFQADSAVGFPAAYSHEVTGSRRSMWIQSNGDVGYASSSRYKKQDIHPAELTAEQILRIPVVHYRYRKAVAAERAGKIEHAATEIGTIAEDLHDLGLWQFVMYEDGKPAGVHYELLSLAAISLGQHLAERLEKLEARLDAAGL